MRKYSGCAIAIKLNRITKDYTIKSYTKVVKNIETYKPKNPIIPLNTLFSVANKGLHLQKQV
ncbi:MAG: hypothetical protein ACJAZ9_000717 [Neolewinella sp.]|jgi:hypothetical protein